MTVPLDHPIEMPDEDLLGYEELAKRFAQQLLELDASRGAVVGVRGPWGSGKTSFLNLVRRHLSSKCTAIVGFNPWMFSDTGELVGHFLAELSAQLRKRGELADLADRLAEYAVPLGRLAWLPALGLVFQGASEAAKAYQEFRGLGRSAATIKSRLDAKLRELGKPLVVVIDDIDRLTTREIREIFKLVRLTAHFPNVIYILAFDRRRVEAALAEDGLPGQQYLDKILHLHIDMPTIRPATLQDLIAKNIEAALGGLKNPGLWHEDRWPGVLFEIVLPLVANVRDIRRYALAVRMTAGQLEGRVALVDVLALEAIRLFMPAVFYELRNLVSVLARPQEWPDEHESEKRVKQLNEMIALAGERGSVVRYLVRYIFPLAQIYLDRASTTGVSYEKWLGQRRVAHEAILRYYLERVSSSALDERDKAEYFFDCMGDRDRFEACLMELPAEVRAEVVSNLEMFEEQFTTAHAEAGVPVLLRLMQDMDPERKGLIQRSEAKRVLMVIGRLLARVHDSHSREDLIRRAWSEVTSLSVKLQLVELVGHRPDVGPALVTPEFASKLETQWRAEVRSASVEALLGEPGLFHVLHFERQGRTPEEEDFSVPDDPRLTVRLLRTARSTAYLFGMEAKDTRISHQLAWESLVGLLGGEEEIRRRVAEARKASVPDPDDVLALAERYLDGWRPEGPS